MKSCPICSKSIADVLGQCPFCRHVFEQVEGTKPTLDPVLISAALDAERASSRGPERGVVQAGLLTLALPVLVPALIWLWIGAKRWGRVDFVLLAVSGFVLTAFSLGSTLLFALMLIADVAAGALFVLRYPKLEEGIFLGYSNAVAMCLILGGLMFGGGAFVTIPLRSLTNLANLYAPESSLSAGQLASGDLPGGPLPVALDAGSIETDGGYVQIGSGAGAAFQRRGSARVQPITSAKSLWERRSELAGSLVQLRSAAAEHTFVREGAELELQPGTKARESGTRVHGMLDGTGGRVYIASELVTGPADAAVAALKAPADRTGRLVVAYADGTMGKAWTPLRMSFQLPYMYVVILPAQPGEGDAKLPGGPTYLSVLGAEGRAWLVFPEGLGAPFDAQVHGVLVPGFPVPPFVDFIRTKPEGKENARLIEVTSRSAYARKSGLLGDVSTGFSPGGLAALAFGSVILAIGVLLALRE